MRLKRKIAQRAARQLARFAAPVCVFKLTGVMPYTQPGERPRSLLEYDEPALFSEASPPACGDRRAWRTSQCNRRPLPHVALSPNGFALSQGAVFNHNAHFLQRESHDYRQSVERAHPRREFVPTPHQFFPRVRRFRQAVVTLTASNQGFYFHWLLEVLPRLYLAGQAGYGRGPFFVETDLPFQRETLRLLGLTEQNLIDSQHTQAVSAENLIVPCHRITPGRSFPRWSVDFLRARFLPQALATRSSPLKRFYVSRRNAGHRRVTNEPEIIAFLVDYGFQPVELEKLAVVDQVALFRDARVIISPHGGGLANLVFCAPGTKVIELFPSANIDLYYRLASCLEIEYFYVRSPEEAGDWMGPADYSIRMVDLKAAIDGALFGGPVVVTGA